MRYLWIFVIGFFFVQATANIFAVEWLQQTIDSVDETLVFAAAVVALYKETRPKKQ